MWQNLTLLDQIPFVLSVFLGMVVLQVIFSYALSFFTDTRFTSKLHACLRKLGAYLRRHRFATMACVCGFSAFEICVKWYRDKDLYSQLFSTIMMLMFAWYWLTESPDGDDSSSGENET